MRSPERTATDFSSSDSEAAMSDRQKLRPVPKGTVRCAIYTRKSTEDGLEQEFNSLDAQREAAEAYIRSQQHEGWTALEDTYDDGGSPVAIWSGLGFSA